MFSRPVPVLENLSLEKAWALMIKMAASLVVNVDFFFVASGHRFRA